MRVCCDRMWVALVQRAVRPVEEKDDPYVHLLKLANTCNDMPIHYCPYCGQQVVIEVDHPWMTMTEEGE